MSEMRPEIANLLRGTPWANQPMHPIAGDASARRYFRITQADGQNAVLMDAPPETCGRQDAFLRLARHLRDIGLAAPDVYLANPDTGVLLLEDLGTNLFAQVAMREPELENRLYEAGINILLHLRRAPPAGLVVQTPEHLTQMTDIAFERYCGGAGVRVEEAAVAQFHTAFRQVLENALSGPHVLVLRDYHAENLVWRPEHQGLNQVGLLDFQDSVIGHPAYDLVSLLQDARRDLANGIEDAMIAHYVEQAGLDRSEFQFAYDAISVQRHLRILGVFARLSLDAKKPHYIDFVPRTWAHLQNALKNPVLESVAGALAALLPSPTPDVLARLRTS